MTVYMRSVIMVVMTTSSRPAAASVTSRHVTRDVRPVSACRRCLQRRHWSAAPCVYRRTTRTNTTHGHHYDVSLSVCL